MAEVLFPGPSYRSRFQIAYNIVMRVSSQVWI